MPRKKGNKKHEVPKNIVEEKKSNNNNIDNNKAQKNDKEINAEKVVFKNDKNKKEEKKVEEKKENVKNEMVEKAKNEILEKKEYKKRKIFAVLIILIVILVLVLIFSTLFALIQSTKNSIAKGITIKNIDVSGLTIDEAKKKLTETFNTILDVDMNLNYKDYKYSIKADDIELAYDFEDELKKAYSVGRNGNIVKCNYELIATALLRKNIDFDYTFNEDNINSIIEDVSTSVPDLVTQCSYYIDGDNLIINPGVDGIKINKESLKEIIVKTIRDRNPLEIIKDFKSENVTIPYENTKADSIDMDKIYGEVHSEPQNAYFTPATETEKAKIFADVDGVDFAISIDEAKSKLDEESTEYVIPLSRKKAEITINEIGLEAFPNKLQEFSTRYDASNWGRSENLKIATKKIDGTVLMPNQQFSFNSVVGERTVQEGYKNAAIFAGDTVVDGLAGGICQVSSTLYNAALLSNLQIDERYNHSFKTSYLEVGRDATVVYGSKDFKFTNNRSYPIKIEGSAENGVVNFAIYGIEEDTEYKINIIPIITSTIPYTTQTITDYSLAPGSQQVTQGGSSGYRVTTYKEKVLNGAVISKEVISNDIYKAMTRIVKVGPSAVPVVAPTTTPADVPDNVGAEEPNNNSVSELSEIPVE